MSSGPDLFISSSSTDKDIVNFLNSFFLENAEQGVHDIHFLIADMKTVIRQRLPSGLDHYADFDKRSGELISDKIRTRASLSLSERKAPLDGRFQLRYPDRKLDVRVAITPTINGSLIVCRLLDQVNSCMSLDDLGVDPLHRVGLEALLAEPHGLFVICGPTGSGKTTTLYGLLGALNDGSRNIITIENPVEYVVSGLAQINVDGTSLTFASALRTVLRQDPDVILVGEIRDAETAQIAVQAAMTGHLVLATLHTNNALQVPLRLIDLGVDPKALSVAMAGACAQRLLPKIDGEPEMAPPNDRDAAWLKINGLPHKNVMLPSERALRKGFVPTLELWLADEAMRDAISASEMEGIARAANNQPWYESISQSGSYAAFNGKIGLSDLRKVSSSLEQSEVSRRYGADLIDTGAVTMGEVREALCKQARAILNGGERTRIGDYFGT